MTVAPGRDLAPERGLRNFIERLESRGYSFYALNRDPPSFEESRVYLRYDVAPELGDFDIALRLAALHERLRIPASFHLSWDLMEGNAQLLAAALRLREFDPQRVHLGLQCDPISEWLAKARFDGDARGFEEFLRSQAFPQFLDELLAAWRKDGDVAPVLRAMREGAWNRLVALDASFRHFLGGGSSISGRGSVLSNAFSAARRARPDLEVIASSVCAIDFLAAADLRSFGFAFEATRFAGDLLPGPTVMFGGAEIPRLREGLLARIKSGGGFLAIFPVKYWGDERYAGLLPAAAESSRIASAPAAVSAPPRGSADGLPAQPIVTSLADLTPFGPKCERVDTKELAAAARRKLGYGIDASFPRFVDWLRSEGYNFSGFEEGPPQFDQRRAYLRHDVHGRDLLAAYVLADLHERFGIRGSFQISWKFSPYEGVLEPYFLKLLEFDRRFVQFGLHAAPTATWYLHEKLAGDCTRQDAVMASEDFALWLRELGAAYARDGEDARELKEIREGTDDTLRSIAASFRDAFGDWKSISAHGNFLSNGFVRVRERHPELRALDAHFLPVQYLLKYGVARFGFELEVTAFGSDQIPFPRLMTEGAPLALRRRWYRGRVANGGGFVALLHPATWTCRHNADFFLPGDGEDP